MIGYGDGRDAESLGHSLDGKRNDGESGSGSLMVKAP